MFTKNLKWFVLLPIAIIVIGVIFGALNGGLNLGIDFTGGNITTVEFGGDFDTDVVKQALDKNGMGDSPIVQTGDNFTQAQIRMRLLPDEEEQANTNSAIIADIRRLTRMQRSRLLIGSAV